MNGQQRIFMLCYFIFEYRSQISHKHVAHIALILDEQCNLTYTKPIWVYEMLHEESSGSTGNVTSSIVRCRVQMLYVVKSVQLRV